MPEPSPKFSASPLSDRIEPVSASTFMVWFLVLGFFAWSVNKTGVSLADLWGGIPQMTRLVGEMLPPSTARLEAVGWALLETFQMAFVGTVVGVLLSVPIAILATPHLSPHPVLYHAARNLIAFFRTVLDLVWALLFVVSVGLGPFAGTLAIVIDKLGFCGRFFAEAMEEVDRGPQEALSAMGTSRWSLIVCAVLPAAMPSFINTSLFSLEKATRSSVVLGLVGAGGIGVKLEGALATLAWPKVTMLLILILATVVFSEWITAQVRKKLI